jgi:putative PIN family toxin of toxin-antitoxin system
MSESTLFELADVLGRKKFDAYVSIQDREEFLRMLGRIVEMITILHAVHDCQDPKDNQILEVAVNEQAQVIVTGVEDLLALNPFRDILILRPADYLNWEEKSPSPS